MGLKNISRLTLLGTAAVLVSGCAFSSGLSPAEQEVKADLAPSNYQPATRKARDNISTQDNFAQAAFWSREYQLNPADLESAIMLTAAVRKMGNPGKAVEIAQTSRALHPKDPYLTAEYAAALIASERGDEAIEALDGGLRVAPGYARLWSLKGAALDQQENYDLARQHYARALQITPRDPNVMSNLGLSYALAGDPATAETWLRRAAEQPGASANIKQTLNMVMQLQGKPASQLAQAQPSPQPPTQMRTQSQTQSQGQYRQQYQAKAQQSAPTQSARPSYFSSYEGRSTAQAPSSQPQQRANPYSRQAQQNYAPRLKTNENFRPTPNGNKPVPNQQRQQPAYSAPSQQLAYRQQPPQTQYKPQAQPQQQAPKAGADYGGGYAVNSPQVQHRSNFTVTGRQPGAPKSAADAARAAAAQSQGQSRKVVVPADAPMSNDVQNDILSQIARNVGPQSSQSTTEPVQLRRRYSPPPQAYAQDQAQTQRSYAQPSEAQQTRSQGYPQPKHGTASRGAARRR